MTAPTAPLRLRTAAALLGLLAASAVHAAPPPVDSSLTPYDRVGVDYKTPQVLTETFFNPFHVQASADAMQKKEGAAVTDEAVTAAIGVRGVSGVLFGARPGSSRIIVGDQVFSIGDELTFPDADKGGVLPLVKGASVVLRRVSRDSMGLDISPETEPTRRMNIPLRDFWHP